MADAALDCNGRSAPVRRELPVDARVASAIAHWAPRFIANGVTASDFQRITAGLAQWPHWCAAWSEVAAEHEALGRSALVRGATLSAGEHLASAAVYYHFAKFVFVDDPDQMRAAHLQAVECLADALPHLRPPGRRVDIPFEGHRLVGVLRCPGDSGPYPTVIMLSGLDSAKEELRATEDTFLARGLATFSVDGPGQGEAEYDLPIRGDWAGPGRAVADVASALPEVDGGRLGVWGVSLGGYYATRVAAALGDRLAACVTLAGPYNFGECWHRSGAVSDHEAHRIAGTLDMAGHAAGITAPLLVVFGRQDRLVPWEQAQRLVDEVTTKVEFLLLDRGNHGCANMIPWHRPFTADWLAARLGGRLDGRVNGRVNGRVDGRPDGPLGG
jgi:2,6-dihydroxypseudooxynicotine hydrolase